MTLGSVFAVQTTAAHAMHADIIEDTQSGQMKEAHSRWLLTSFYSAADVRKGNTQKSESPRVCAQFTESWVTIRNQRYTTNQNFVCLLMVILGFFYNMFYIAF